MVDTGGKDLIVADNIQQSFKVGEETINVINRCSFKIKENSFNVVFGPSGSGKSTLLNIMSGLQDPTQGTLYYQGHDVYKLSANRLAQFRGNEIGIVYQSPFWVASLNVIENVSIPLYFSGYSRVAANRLAMNALQRVDMVTYAKKSPLFLSGGEQQRVSVARAIVNDPSLIIADEPTGSLDSKNGDMVMSLLQSFKRDLNRTVVLVTHNMEYMAMADHLLNIHDGIVDDLAEGDISKTTDQLVESMRLRIERFGKLKYSKTQG